jgi:hypothetical protein
MFSWELLQILIENIGYDKIFPTEHLLRDYVFRLNPRNQAPQKAGLQSK